jgi:hypothetical protein
MELGFVEAILARDRSCPPDFLSECNGFKRSWARSSDLGRSVGNPIQTALRATIHDRGVRGFRASAKWSWCGFVATRQTIASGINRHAPRRIPRIRSDPASRYRRVRAARRLPSSRPCKHGNRATADDQLSDAIRAITGARPSQGSRPRPSIL